MNIVSVIKVNNALISNLYTLLYLDTKINCFTTSVNQLWTIWTLLLLNLQNNTHMLSKSIETLNLVNYLGVQELRNCLQNIRPE